MAVTAKFICDTLSNTIPLTPNYDSRTTSYISAYGIFDTRDGKRVIIRVADHGTYLFHWAEKNSGLDLSQTANYAITFKESIGIIHNTKISGTTAPVFIIRQYVYDCSLLDNNDVALILEAILKLVDEGVYSDPFIETPKHAIIWREESNKPPVDITTRVAKQKRKRERKRQKNK